MTKLRAAVVGAGVMGRLHARVLSESDEVELVAVVDPDRAAERIAYDRHSEWLASVDELLALKPDFVVVAVPTSGHAAVAERLLSAGIPTLVEKPIAATVEEATALIDAAGAAGVPLAVGHVEWFNPAVRALAERLAAGELGRIFQIHTRRLSPFPVRVGDAGVALDLATHDLDVMSRLAGRPLRISAEHDRRGHRTHEDLLVASLRFESGIIGLLETNWLTPTKIRQLTVTGERGMFVVDYLAQHLTLYENALATENWFALDVFEGVTEGNITRFAIPRVEPLKAQLDSFLAAVRGEAPVAADAVHGRRILALALAVVAAGDRGSTVTLDADWQPEG